MNSLIKFFIDSNVNAIGHKAFDSGAINNLIIIRKR